MVLGGREATDRKRSPSVQKKGESRITGVRRIFLILIPVIVIGLLFSGVTFIKSRNDLSKHNLRILPDICNKKSSTFGYNSEVFVPITVVLVVFSVSTIILNRETYKRFILSQEHFKPPCPSR